MERVISYNPEARTGPSAPLTMLGFLRGVFLANHLAGTETY